MPRTLFTFNSKEDVQQFATGCDADIGGMSTVHLELDESPEMNASIGGLSTAKFWGDMRLEVKSGLEKKLRGGYAGFRNKVKSDMYTLGAQVLLLIDFCVARLGRRSLEICWKMCQITSTWPFECEWQGILEHIIRILRTSKPMVLSRRTYGSIGYIFNGMTMAGKISL